MTTYRGLYNETLDESYYPLDGIEIRLAVDASWAIGDIPPSARRRLVLDALRRAVSELAPDDLESVHDAQPFSSAPTTPSTAPTGAHSLISTRHEEPDSTWVQPAGMDLRILKSAHRIIQEIARRGQSGRAVLAAELVQDGLVSAPTMSRLLNPDEKAGEYLAPFILVVPSGRTRALDLTPKGRIMASKIRAGVVPT